ncbi:MAG: LysR substrate-binding domain-containing protein [Actinomycetota bacterium]
MTDQTGSSSEHRPLRSTPMRLDVESLRCLQVVVETGGFTGAASRLGLTQSAVSWKIKRLEERVGLELIKRGRHMEATPDGQDLLRYAARIVDAHDEAVSHLSRSDLEGVIRVGTNQDLHGRDLADVFARFGRAHPGVSLEVRVHLSGIVKEWLDDGEVQVAVLQLPLDEVRPDDVVLWQEPVHWMTGRGFRHAGAAQNRPADEPIPIVTFGPGLAYLDLAEESLARAGFRWRVALECPMLSGVQSAVESGLGIAPLNSGNITDGMAQWEHDGRCPMPDVCQVVRTGGEDRPEILALRDSVSDAMRGR